MAFAIKKCSYMADPEVRQHVMRLGFHKKTCVWSSSSSVGAALLARTWPPQWPSATTLLTAHKFSNVCTQPMRSPPLPRLTTSTLVCLSYSQFLLVWYKGLLCKIVFFHPHHMASPSKSTRLNKLYMYKFICIYVFMYVCTTRIFTCIYIHTHTHTHTHHMHVHAPYTDVTSQNNRQPMVLIMG